MRVKILQTLHVSPILTDNGPINGKFSCFCSQKVISNCLDDAKLYNGNIGEGQCSSMMFGDQVKILIFSNYLKLSNSSTISRFLSFLNNFFMICVHILSEAAQQRVAILNDLIIFCGSVLRNQIKIQLPACFSRCLLITINFSNVQCPFSYMASILKFNP